MQVPLRPGGEGLLAGAVFRMPQGKEEGAAPVIWETQIEHLLIDRSIDCASHTPRGRLAMEQAQVTITRRQGEVGSTSPRYGSG